MDVDDTTGNDKLLSAAARLEAGTPAVRTWTSVRRRRELYSREPWSNMYAPYVLPKGAGRRGRTRHGLTTVSRS